MRLEKGKYVAEWGRRQGQGQAYTGIGR